MRVAVVGAGVFGATAAVELARAGIDVDLYDAKADILSGATAACQARLHSGYHYPRSPATAAAVRDASPVFEARFPSAIRRARQHYCVANDSHLTAANYLAFCDRLGLPYEVCEPPTLAHNVSVCIRVPEAFVDVPSLRRTLRGDLHRARVNLRLGQRVEVDALAGYDRTVFATYGQPWPSPLRYEICEVALVQLGGRYDGQSYVVMDGDYVSLDPTSDRNTHKLYDVVHTVHAANVGFTPVIPDEYVGLIDRPGPVHTPLSHFEAMVDSASRFLRGVGMRGQGITVYAGSLFTVRAVLPDVDATDERPTLIRRDGDVISVLSGKITTAVVAARQVVAEVCETTVPV